MSGLNYNQIAMDIINSDGEYIENQTIIPCGGQDTVVRSEIESLENEISVLADVDENIPDYQFTVDWGDGTIAEYTSTASTEAIYHTYEKPGTYDVAINGFFRVIINGQNWSGDVVYNGDYFRDKDGVVVKNGCNYAMCYHLIKVISWGNTNLRSCDQAFTTCTKLSQIPMYDTTNSFENVTDCSEMFAACTALKEIPFDSNAQRGLFSGCKKVTTFANLFSGCTGLRGEIPIKLVENSSNCTSLHNMFLNCYNLTGGIPVGMFDGMPNLTNAAGVFDGCTNLVDTLPERLFPNNPKITTIEKLFYNCRNISGQIGDNFISSLRGLTNMRLAFYNCSKITGITANAFSGLTSNNLNCHGAFWKSGVMNIPSGLLESLTGNGIDLGKMFSGCISLKTIPSTIFSSFNNVKDARGIFENCTNLTSSLPTPPPSGDWDNEVNIRKWYGAFSRSNQMNGFSAIALELGGNGNRKFVNNKIGAIVLSNKTFVDVTGYTYNPSNKPIGIVYAHNSDNIVRFMSLNYGNYAWCDERTHYKDTPVINGTNTSSAYIWGRYDAKSNTDAIRTFNDYIENPSWYPAFDYCINYSTDGFPAGSWYFGGGSDVWDIYIENGLMQNACDKIISEGGFSSSNCRVAIPDINASVETQVSQAWALRNGYYQIDSNGGKSTIRKVIPVSYFQL